MTDKVQKIREEVARLKSQLVKGACASQIAMETRCKEEAYNEVLAILDSLQEEPKFKTGDRIKSIDSCLGSPRIIEEVCDGWYVTNQGTLDFEFEDNWEAVEESVNEVWHDANEEQPEEYRTVVVWNPITMDGEVLTRCAEVYKERIWAYIEDLLKLSNVQRTVKNWKEPVSEDLEEACEQLAENARKHKAETSSPFFSQWDYKQGVIDGAKWNKEHLWKPADGDDLPIIDREVIALLDNGKVVFAHRPPKYWDGKDIVTGKVTRNYPKTYDKGGWNIPDTKWWLDVELPKEIEL